jgi:hypothetical protein
VISTRETSAPTSAGTIRTKSIDWTARRRIGVIGCLLLHIMKDVAAGYLRVRAMSSSSPAHA